MKEICANDGAVVQGLRNSGRRKRKTGGRGGPRQKKQLCDYPSKWVHPDAIEVRQRPMENINFSFATSSRERLTRDNKIIDGDGVSTDASENEDDESITAKIFV